MKRIIALIIGITFIFSGCFPNKTVTKDKPSAPIYRETEEMKAIWISCYDYNFSNLSQAEIEAEVESMLDKIKSAGLDTVFLHTRANGDAIYPSSYFPYSENISNDIDLLKIFVSAAHERGLKLHAWVNPYRISSKSGDAYTLLDGSIIKNWAFSPETAHYVVSYNNKLYLNPSPPEVQKLVLDGVREILENYDVEGIHFDDYFYPTTEEGFDAISYNTYTAGCSKPLDLTEWRCANISSLISSVYKLCQSKSVLFGVSPTAYIGGDYIKRNGYADIKKWLENEGFVDYIIPQIYWGFEYPEEEYRFDNMCDKWILLKNNSNKAVYVGLAAYKIGTEDLGDEWIKESAILKKQAKQLYEAGFDGFSLFSYSSFFSEKTENTKERIAFLEYIQNK